MIIYKGLFELNYNPATDILVMTLPNMTELSLYETKQCFEIVITHIRHYDVKKLLLDSSNSVIDSDDASYQATVLQFGKNLLTTRLQRLARVGTTDKIREEKSAQASNITQQQLNMPIDFASFSTFSEAMDRLLATDSR